MTVRLQCPNPDCQAPYSVDEANLGRLGRCKKCGRVFKLGGPSDGDPTVNRSGLPAAPKELTPGMRFGGRYDVRRKLGGGGMGVVYLAHDTQLGRDVALKLPLVKADDEAYEEVIRRFMREARAAARLDHPNICPVYDIGQVEGRLYLTMAYIEGELFSSLLAKGPLSEARAAEVVLTLARALSEAHRHGVVHRDLKPANILVSPRRGLVITDFGLARGVGSDDSRVTQSGQLLGTPSYMPPEQVRGDVKAMGPGCDVYSLGVILYELLTGLRPFTGQLFEVLAKILTQDPEPPSQHRPGLDRRLEAICRKAMEKAPGDRFATMAAFARALEEYLESSDARDGSSDQSGDMDGRGVVSGLPPSGANVKIASPQPESTPVFMPAKVATRSPQPPPATPPAPVVAPAGPPAPAIKHAEPRPGRAPAGQPGKAATRAQEPPSPSPPARLTNSLGMTFVRIEPGEFTMGSTEEDDEKPPHLVKITRPYYLGAHEVTQRQYLEVMGVNPSYFKGPDDLPVERVSWLDAVDFCNKLSEKEGRTPCYRIEGYEVTVVDGNGYHLPTEAEWEYACRAGSTSRFPFGNDEAELGEHAWFNGNSDSKTHAVGQKRPNRWGLYDMLGNVWEWCQDGYDAEYYAKSPPADPPGPPKAPFRVIRGGSWNYHPRYCRPAYRSGYSPGIRGGYLGFRVAAVQQ